MLTILLADRKELRKKKLSEGEKEKNREKSESSDEKREENKKSKNQVRSSPLKNIAPLKEIYLIHMLP